MNATMLKIDETILESNKIICRQISRLGTSTRGEVSQEVLESLRHFVEHIILKEYANGGDIEDTHDNIKAAVKFAKNEPQLIHTSRFHHFLQVSSSHRVLKEHNAERLRNLSGGLPPQNSIFYNLFTVEEKHPLTFTADSEAA